MSDKKIPNMSVSDGFDFVNKMWGSLPVPGLMSPTTDLDELDKRIADLKAVEQWLNVNLSMLRATIQGLEVQRGTIATIKSFGAHLGADPASHAERASPAATTPESSSAMMSNATAWWSLMQDQFNKAATAAMAGQGLGAAGGEEKQPDAKKAKRAPVARKKPASGSTRTRS